MDEELIMEKELEELRVQHSRLDQEINGLLGGSYHDQLYLQRLKKKKLQLRDQIATLEETMYPDIIA